MRTITGTATVEITYTIVEKIEVEFQFDDDANDDTIYNVLREMAEQVADDMTMQNGNGEYGPTVAEVLSIDYDEQAQILECAECGEEIPEGEDESSYCNSLHQECVVEHCSHCEICRSDMEM